MTCWWPQALADTPPERAEWVLLIDQDAIVDDMSFNLPLRRYGEADLVLLADQALVAGDQYRSHASLKLGEPQQGALKPDPALSPALLAGKTAGSKRQR